MPGYHKGLRRNPGDTTTIQTQIELLSKGLRIGHWNVQHLASFKFEQIGLLLTTCKKIDILFLQETFLNATKPDSAYNISSYILHQRDRENKSGGGLPAYVAEEIKTKRNSMTWKIEAVNSKLDWNDNLAAIFEAKFVINSIE